MSVQMLVIGQQVHWKFAPKASFIHLRSPQVHLRHLNADLVQMSVLNSIILACRMNLKKLFLKTMAKTQDILR
jgi:hypothetical protein